MKLNDLDLFKEVVEQLFKLNKDSEILVLMDEKPKRDHIYLILIVNVGK